MPPQFGRYTVRRKLGEGGMGAVYLVTAPDGAPFALKTLRAEHSENAEFVKRFLREAGIALKLRHPNIVTTHEQAQAPDGTLYMVTELCPKGGLDGVLIARERIGVPEALFWMAGVARALDYAFQTFHVIHRDIKPANLLLDGAWNIKLADLGLARRTDANATRLTMEGTIVGSVSYMSPEQALAGELDIRSDLYALGATFYHLLSGEPVFVGSTVAHVIKMHVKETPERLSARTDGLHVAVVNLIHRLLEKDPDDRPPDAAALLAEITAVAAEIGVSLDAFPGGNYELIPNGGASAAGGSSSQIAASGSRAKSLDQHTLALHGVAADHTVVAEAAYVQPLPPSALFRLTPRAEDPTPQEPRAWLQIAPVSPASASGAAGSNTTGLPIDMIVYAGGSVRAGRAIGEGVDLPLRVYPVADNKTLCMRISSQHAQFSLAVDESADAETAEALHGAWVLTDLASHNGIKIDDRRLAASVPEIVPDRAILDFAGAVRLRARLVGEPTPPILTLDGALFEPNPEPALVLTREQNRPELAYAFLRDQLPIGGVGDWGRTGLARAFQPAGGSPLLQQPCGTLWWRDGRFWWQPVTVTSLNGQTVQPAQLAPLSTRGPGTQWRTGGLQFSFRAFSLDLFR
ncbi:MAG TPA: FHA domain-containing serine/threonine-protein kinase [Planctomycetota bacterium]|nr:FHA domain-containing serine/threonine-protein kinase [Planctomycetota bacterium]